MTATWTLHPDRVLPADPTTRAIAREILAQTATLPIVSMHGHVDAGMLADNAPFADPADLLVTPDHYLVRLLVSQATTPGPIRDSGVVSVADLGMGPEGERDSRVIWRRFCAGWAALRGTATRGWLEHVLVDVFESPAPPSLQTADVLYDHVAERLASPQFRPRALFERFNIEILATTDPADDALANHARLRRDGWGERVVPTLRPDAVLNGADPEFAARIERLGAATGRAITDYASYLDALRERRAWFIAAGARATDHGAVSTAITPLADADAARLFDRALRAPLPAGDADAFQSHMLFQMAAMSVDDGLTMQFHPGVLRDHDPAGAARHGHDIGFDIPVKVEFTRALQPLLAAFGHHPHFRLIAFTTDETTYSRELAPLAGAYPALRLGAPWWFLDAPDAMRRFRELVTETAGLANLTGFVDDTRAFCSIPARHDVARRVDAGHLARMVAEHRLPLDEAIDSAIDLAYRLPLASYPIPHSLDEARPDPEGTPQ